MPDNKKLELMEYKLKGEASIWWEHVRSKRRIVNKLSVVTWKRMKRQMIQQFVPLDYEQILYQHYHQCHKDNKNINEYIEEFIRLGIRANMWERKSQEVSKYVQDRTSPVQEKLELS